MAVYPTKTSMLNKRKTKFNVGISLATIFSLLLLFLVFDLLPIFTIIVIGIFGLLIYPVSIFFVVLGILLILNKELKTSKITVLLSILWVIFFVLILQLATSSEIDSGFSSYITNTFKNDVTAGGVIFSLLLYPFYILTYNVACYILFSIALVVITGFMIDKIYNEFKNNKDNHSFNNLENNAKRDDDTFINQTEDDDEYEEKISELDSPQILNDSISNDEIFIEDEEENENRIEAKNILGLNQNNSDNKFKEVESYKDKLEKPIINEKEKFEQINNNPRKPNIFVHEDDLSINSHSENTYNNLEKKKIEKKIDPNEERRKAALEYLNISSGKFETKSKGKGIDNLKTETNAYKDNKINSINKELKEQSNNNLNRIDNLNSRINNLTNNQKELIASQNPFRQKELNNSNNNNVDVFDEKFTKKEFIQKTEQIRQEFSSNKPLIPERAKREYTGEVKENLVENNSFRPVQVSMNDPIKVHKPEEKVFKKPAPYKRPPIDLLKRYSDNLNNEDETMKEKGELIVETLRNFKIETKIINAVKGPTFTRYELQMAPGISVNAVNNKIKDLQMALEGNCRAQVPIPGKNAFGIEVPNRKRMTVGLRDIIESSNFQNSKSPLTFALGKDITADCKVACVDKLVHSLVAGSTGSGKSVCLNTMLVSLLYKASPEDLRLLLVDPKAVEFSLFNNLPHMLIPNTITDCDKAVDALSWLVTEMDRRYKKLSSIGVKKISEYNESPEVTSGTIPKMYYIVMIFDEVGDFMVRSRKEIEEKIVLLAQKARACGIHLVLATQRPSKEVITGTIKANLQTRISFAVNSSIDSRVILDSVGAEYLLGMGDMLYLPQGSNDPERIQGCFVDNNELKAVINYIKENNECDFDEEIEDQMFNKNDGFDPTNGAEEVFDPLMKDCLRFFIKSKKASASSLQAAFGIGYPKANKIIMQMEKAGFVSAGDNNGRRSLFITQQEFEERFGEDL